MCTPGVQQFRLLVLLVVFRASTCDYLDVMKSACPFTDFCTVMGNTSTSPGHGGYIPCCSPCTCDAGCWMVDNCCPDVPHKPPVDLRKAGCQVNYVNRSLAPQYQSVISYKMIDFCPCDYEGNNKDIVEKCNFEFSGHVTLDDIVAVSDAKNRIYRNKYCALCHGVADTISWDLVLTECDEEFFSMVYPASDLVRTLMGYCSMVFSPPGTLPYAGRLMRCGQAKNQCSAQTSSDIEEGCYFGPDMPYFSTNVGTVVQYKNAFCKLCNVGGSIGDVLCSKDLMVDTRSSLSLIALLVNMKVSEKIPPKQSLDCLETDVFDHAKGECIRLHCQRYSFPNNGKCIPIGNWHRGGLVITLQLEPTTNDVKLEQDRFQSPYSGAKQNDFAIHTLQLLGIEHCSRSLTYFFANAFAKRTHNILEFVEVGAVMQLEEEHNVKCNLDYFKSALRNKVENYINMSMEIGNDDVAFAGKINFFSKNNGVNSFLDYDHITYFYQQVILINLKLVKYVDTGFFLCPYFVLNLTQYNGVMDDMFGRESRLNVTEISQFTRVKDGFFTLSPQRIAVCADTYFDLYGVSGKYANVARVIMPRSAISSVALILVLEIVL